MKNYSGKRAEKLMRSLSSVDDKYIDEASPENVTLIKAQKRARKGTLSKRTVLIAASLCLAFAILLTSVILPLAMRDDVSRLPAIEPEGAGEVELSNDYSSLLEKLAAYKENAKDDYIYDLPTSDVEDGADEDETRAEVPDTVPSEDEEKYEEVTDNQADGVIESDIIKRSNKYIYYLDLSERLLRVYSIDGELSSQISSLSLKDISKSVNAQGRLYDFKFFLSADCRSIIFIARCYTSQVTYTYIISYDVSDPENITLKNTVTLSGDCIETRYADGRLLIVTSYGINKNDIDLTDETTFLPKINGNCVDGKSVYAPEVIERTAYTVVTVLDENELDVCDTISYISYYCNDIYVSAENLYIWRSYRDVISDTEKCLEYKTVSEISAVSYSDSKLSHKGSVSVKGTVKDQYCLDEYKGVLRVFTSSYDTRIERYDLENVPESYKMFPSEIGFDRSFISNGKRGFCFENENANLFCIRVKDFEFVAEILEFAPEDENIKSARFDGDIAYVCTSVDFYDPVFFFDLSNLRNITYKDTGTIEGYSTSLIDIGDRLLLGIGYGKSKNVLKVELYREGKKDVESVSVHEETAHFSLEYKSYMIDRKNKLIAVPISRMQDLRSEQQSGFLLLSYENGTLEVIDFILVREKYGMEYCYRAVYIDGYIYAFADKGFFCVKRLG